jgi:hypothetical protein
VSASVIAQLLALTLELAPLGGTGELIGFDHGAVGNLGVDHGGDGIREKLVKDRSLGRGIGRG